MTPDLHVALVAPEIPWNTGNAGRTCLAVGARLHLVRPFGFRLDARHLRRAGLDYWQHVDLETWSGWEAFEAALSDEASPLGSPIFFTAEADRSFWDDSLWPAGPPSDSPIDASSESPIVLVFGPESTGFPPAVRSRIQERWPERRAAIPMAVDRARGPVRSLNLSTAVAVAVYEARRRLGGSLTSFTPCRSAT